MERQKCEMQGRRFGLTGPQDRLLAMFKAQENFARRFVDFSTLTDTERDIQLQKFSVAGIMEGAESLEETNWKHWKKTKKELDREAYLFEVCDKLAFMFNEVLTLGYSEEDLFQHFMRKVEINHDRQEKKY